MNSLRKHVAYDDLNLEIWEDVYEPAEDTFLVADALNQVVQPRNAVLDVGTGCGILAIIAAKKTDKVVAIDANPYAVECAKRNAENNNVASRIDLRLGDLFQPVRKAEKFDVIIFNAPYLPSSPKEEKTWLERAWAGGPRGRRFIDQFIAKAPEHLKKHGKILLVQSSLADINKTLRMLNEKKLEATVIAGKKEPFERIVVIRASILSRNKTKKQAVIDHEVSDPAMDKAACAY